TSRTPTADELALVEQLAKHPDPRVRSMITLAVPRIMNSDRSRAIRLLLSVDLAGNSGVAGNVLFQLSSGLLSVSDLPAANRIALLDGLAGCPDISLHPIEVFLGKMAWLHPDEVIAMLMARVDHGADRGWDFNHTLPFAWGAASELPGGSSPTSSAKATAGQASRLAQRRNCKDQSSGKQPDCRSVGTVRRRSDNDPGVLARGAPRPARHGDNRFMLARRPFVGPAPSAFLRHRPAGDRRLLRARMP